MKTTQKWGDFEVNKEPKIGNNSQMHEKYDPLKIKDKTKNNGHETYQHKSACLPLISIVKDPKWPRNWS